MKKIKKIYHSFKDLFSNRRLILELAKKDFNVRYAGSYLGIIWGFIQPAVTILVLWFVFQIGFRSMPIENFPFILWLLSGMVPWFFISEAISTASYSLIEYSYLVKKIVFKVSSLPIIKVLSALFVHMFFVIFLFIIFALYGYGISIYSLQVIYYLIASIILVISLVLISSSIMPFLKDLGQIINIILQLLFWITPIFWDVKNIPKYTNLFKLNLVYYIIEGYRDSLIYHIWFWQKWKLTLYFWIVTILMLLIGIKLFKNLKPHFSDVL